jgi:hypothetical protein
MQELEAQLLTPSVVSESFLVTHDGVPREPQLLQLNPPSPG